MIKNLPANAGNVRDVSSIPGLEDPLEEGIATHYSILAWRITRTEISGELQPIGLQSWTRLKQLSTHARAKDQTCFNRDSAVEWRGL